MNELQIDNVLGTISEPIENVVLNADSTRKMRNEIERICRIFKINEEQNNKNKTISIKNLSTMKVVFSNN